MIRLGPKIEKQCATPQGREEALEFLPILQENIRGIDKKIGSRLATVAILCLIFELITRSAIISISITGIQISEYSVVEKLMPALATFLYFDSWMLVSSRRLLEKLHDNIISCANIDLYAADIELYLRGPNIIKTYELVAREAGGKLADAVRISLVPIAMVLFLSVPIFIIYSFVRLFSKFGYFDPLAIISLTISLFFLSQTMLILVALWKVDHQIPAKEDDPA